MLYILYILHAVSLKDEEVGIGLDTYITCIDRSDLIEFGDNSVQNMRIPSCIPVWILLLSDSFFIDQFAVLLTG